MSPANRFLVCVTASPVFLIALGIVFALAAIVPCATAQPTVGFVETWPGSSLQGWSGNVLELDYANAGTGGVDANDGFLRITRSGTPFNFGTRSSGVEYLGDWWNAGISQVRVWLSDLGQDDPIEIHFSIGAFTNLWQYDVGFVPPVGTWAEFVVDLTDSASFTNIIAPIGDTGFALALLDVQVVHFRHDLAPFMQTPDPVAGDVGIDHLLLTNGVVGVPPTPARAAIPVELGLPRPNPSRGSVALTVHATEATEVSIHIVDTQGRRVRQHALGPVQGSRTWTWDRLDQYGRRVPAGIYRARVVSRQGGTSRSITLMD